MTYFNKLIKEYKNSPSLIYFLSENKAITMGLIATLAFVIRFALAMQTNNITDALANALEFSSIISTSVIAVLLYFKDAVNLQIVKKISDNHHTVIFGLGEFSGALLENEIATDNRYIIFEKNIQNDRIEYFRKHGMGVVEGDALSNEQLEKLNFTTMDYAVIALGNDRLNIELATNIIQYYIDKGITTNIKLVIHIINQDLNALFHQKFIMQKDDQNGNIDIQTFSFYEEAAESFFEENFVDGESDAILKGSDDYHMIIAGNGELASNLIYQVAKLAHLPNENRLHIHIVDKDAESFKRKLIKRYTGILEVLDLEAVNSDSETLEYFQKKELWFQDNLTHVLVCYDDEEKNVNIATDLFNKTYLSDAVDGVLKTRISFAIFNAYHMSSKIDADKESFKQFFSFGDVQKICTRENLLDEKHDFIAKLIHFWYAEMYNPNELIDVNNKQVLKKWYDASRLSDRLSSKAQSKHIDMKLKVIGLKKILSSKNPSELLKINRELFDSKLAADRASLGLSNEFLQNYSKELSKFYSGETFEIKYFPKEFNTLLEKLIRAEHNRWNAFHYLNGWAYDKVKSKPKKKHDCLLPLAEFKKPELQLTVIYDIYAILYIPNYLANAGYEIVCMNDVL